MREEEERKRIGTYPMSYVLVDVAVARDKVNESASKCCN
jgi:hypothetical protein